MMNVNEFDRMNTLSEKILSSTASICEIEEFSVLLNLWKSSEKFNLVIDLPQY
ncbi:hypothetical protein [Colwellia hornerae]|uniref:hypothetical protein n=1 Tax=Colwellia hornerae TaxID=89402 RepID=UPI00147907DB|nr:hypothetical protein [Colwellia hornerae]